MHCCAITGKAGALGFCGLVSKALSVDWGLYGLVSRGMSVYLWARACLSIWGSAGSCLAWRIAEISTTQLVLLGMRNRTLVPCLANRGHLRLSATSRATAVPRYCTERLGAMCPI
jgi:hypothetical protein